MTNPKADARTAVATALAGVGTVHPYPPKNLGGSAVVITTARMGVRGHVILTARVYVPQASGLPALEQLEWDTLEAVKADGHIGWAETVPQMVDPDAQAIYTEYELTLRST